MGPIGPYRGPRGPFKGPLGQKKNVLGPLDLLLGVFLGSQKCEIYKNRILVKSISKVLTSMSLVRPKLVQWRYSHRNFVTKINKKIKHRRCWDPPIQGPTLGPMFPLWAALCRILFGCPTLHISALWAALFYIVGCPILQKAPAFVNRAAHKGNIGPKIGPYIGNIQGPLLGPIGPM